MITPTHCHNNSSNYYQSLRLCKAYDRQRRYSNLLVNSNKSNDRLQATQFVSAQLLNTVTHKCRIIIRCKQTFTVASVVDSLCIKAMSLDIIATLQCDTHRVRCDT